MISLAYKANVQTAGPSMECSPTSWRDMRSQALPYWCMKHVYVCYRSWCARSGMGACRRPLLTSASWLAPLLMLRTTTRQLQSCAGCPMTGCGLLLLCRALHTPRCAPYQLLHCLQQGLCSPQGPGHLDGLSVSYKFLGAS